MKIKYFAFKSDYQTATIKQTDAQQLEGTTVVYTEKPGEYNETEREFFFLLDKTQNLYYQIRCHTNTTQQQIIDWYMPRKNVLNKDGLINSIKNKLEHKEFTNNLDIFICYTFGLFELAEQCKINRENYLEIQRQKEENEKREREQKELERQKQEQEKQEQELVAINQKAINGGYLYAAEFEKLCKKYNININIKTLGWLRKYCYQVLVKPSENNKFVYSYSKGHPSTSIYTYVEQLRQALAQ